MISGVKADISEVKNRVLKIELKQENIIIPRIQLLAEGHSEVVNRLRDLDELSVNRTTSKRPPVTVLVRCDGRFAVLCPGFGG